VTCGICEKHLSLFGLPGGVIFQNDYLFVAHFPFLSGQPLPHYGHLIIEFKRHITNPAQMTESEARELGYQIQRFSEALENSLGAEHVYIFRIGDKTPHLHFHLVPRFNGTPKEAWGVYLYESPLGKKANENEIIELSNRVRVNLK
jgi:histidine triad (HIT) family protein